MCGDLMHTGFEWGVKDFGLEVLIPTGPALLTELACPIHTYAVAFNQVAEELLALRRP